MWRSWPLKRPAPQRCSPAAAISTLLHFCRFLRLASLSASKPACTAEALTFNAPASWPTIGLCKSLAQLGEIQLGSNPVGVLKATHLMPRLLYRCRTTKHSWLGRCQLACLVITAILHDCLHCAADSHCTGANTPATLQAEQQISAVHSQTTGMAQCLPSVNPHRLHQEMHFNLVRSNKRGP